MRIAGTGPQPVGHLPNFTQPPPAFSRSTVAQPNGTGALGGSLISIAATPNAAAVGDMVLVQFCWALASVALSTVTDTSGNTWNVVSHAAGGSESGGYGWTIVTTGWSSGANTVTGTLASGAPGGRCWTSVIIPAAYSPTFDQHNEGTSTGNTNITTSSALAQTPEEVIISDLVRTSPSGSPVWQWNQNFTGLTAINGSGTPGSGCAIASYTAISDTLAVKGGFVGLNSGDNHGTSIIAFKVTIPQPASGNQAVNPPAATASASAPLPGLDAGIPAPAATAAVSSPLPGLDAGIKPPAATAAASSPVAGLNVAVGPPAATAAVSAPVPTVAAGFNILPPAATASVSAPIPSVDVKLPPPAATASVSSPVEAVGLGIAPAAATAAASSPIPGLALKATPPAATAAVSGPLPAVNLGINPPAGTASTSSPIAGLALNINPPATSVTVSAPIPTVVEAGGGGGTPGIVYMNLTIIGESANSSTITKVE